MKKLYVTGLGPGKIESMTIEAKASILKADIVVGYTKYIELIKCDFPEKEFFETGMTREAERCSYALDQAARGKTITIVCSGDSGVYGMAALILELADKKSEYADIDIEIVPGITAAISGAAKLGSPFTADFAVISLSNLLTSQELIEKRLRAAAAGDFAMAIYNPKSKSRPDALKNACSILLESIPAQRVCGYVRNIGREGEEAKICSLEELKDCDLDMFCTVFIGNSLTKVIDFNNKKQMVTPRGYRELKKENEE